MSYYGLISGLPKLQPLKSPVLEPDELRGLIAQYTSEKDQQIIDHFFYQIDLINLNAAIQQKDLWLNGGNFSKETLSRWLKKGSGTDTFFDEEESPLEEMEKDKLKRLQNYWQLFFKNFQSLANESLDELIKYEITLRNFFKGYLERKIKAKEGVHFIAGGHFDRFAYNKLLIGDIQAEYPFLAAVLAHFDEEDPFIREEKMLVAKWKFYDYQGFFNAFELVGLITWLFKYLDAYKWSHNNQEKGAKMLRSFSNQLTNQINTQLA